MISLLNSIENASSVMVPVTGFMRAREWRACPPMPSGKNGAINNVSLVPKVSLDLPPFFRSFLSTPSSFSVLVPLG